MINLVVLVGSLVLILAVVLIPLAIIESKENDFHPNEYK